MGWNYVLTPVKDMVTAPRDTDLFQAFTPGATFDVDSHCYSLADVRQMAAGHSEFIEFCENLWAERGMAENELMLFAYRY